MKFYLICGIGHSGTRLLFNLLKQHPLVTAPDESYIGTIREYWPLSKTVENEIFAKYYNTNYSINAQRIYNELDIYMSLCNLNKKVILIKIPTYPIFIPEVFTNFFGENLQFIYTLRDTEKILESFRKRNEILYIQERFKICGLYTTDELDINDVFHQINKRIKNVSNNYKIKTVDVTRMCTDLNYFIDTFNNLDLPIDELSAISIGSIIEVDRI